MTDRLIQQAISQILSKEYDSTFQLLTFNGLFKEYVKKFKDGELDKYKQKAERRKQVHTFVDIGVENIKIRKYVA